LQHHARLGTATDRAHFHMVRARHERPDHESRPIRKRMHAENAVGGTVSEFDKIPQLFGGEVHARRL